MAKKRTPNFTPIPVFRTVDSPPEHWFQNTVVTNHSEVALLHLTPGAPISIEFKSGHTKYCVFDHSTPTQIFYWRNDKAPREELCEWENVYRVTVLSTYELAQIGRNFTTSPGSRANGEIH
jgi:hypothetical protein